MPLVAWYVRMIRTIPSEPLKRFAVAVTVALKTFTSNRSLCISRRRGWRHDDNRDNIRRTAPVQHCVDEDQTYTVFICVFTAPRLCKPELLKESLALAEQEETAPTPTESLISHPGLVWKDPLLDFIDPPRSLTLSLKWRTLHYAHDV